MSFLLILLNVYFVSFLDKPEKTAPQLSPRAVEQRAKWHIQTDGMDYPVSPMYMDSLRRMGVQIYHKSRWFNGVTVEMDKELAGKVAALKFVTDVEETRDNSDPIYGAPGRQFDRKTRAVPMENKADDDPYTDDQLNLYNLKPLHELGYKGKKILMAVCDGGFYDVDKLTCFPQEQELGHFDFTDDGDDFYGSSGNHGAECLSTIVGNVIQDGHVYYEGAAPEVQYYLMRSEEMRNNSESPKEMDNLVVALETADSLGVNIFSVSLGYAKFDNGDWTLDKSDLDGKTTRVSRAATIAARKGMLVCVAAGNEGNDEWKTISAPADADSVLTVGAVNIYGGIGSFSSYGPSADGRVKPDVCAVGVQTVLLSPETRRIVWSNGTSFATPLIAGLAASLWSALPNENAMQIRERIIRSSDRYSNPDPQRYGYGIPDAWAAYQMNLPMDIESIQPSEVRSQKVLRNGQLLIIRGERTYSVTGQRIE